jgi:hypothetical protein
LTMLAAAASDPDTPRRVVLGDRHFGQVSVSEAGGANP